MLSTGAGGIGLFLLGMTMMTDGLKVAAGPALERILAGATRTRWHALGSGMLVTALVQSSSAVTVAAIGFVNAGLLGLGGALWVLFGANVGTTMTGWIVALVGLKFKVEALALPLVGLGVVARLTGAGQQRGALGSALAGFGLLFLGIAMLQESFTGLAQEVRLPQGEGLLPALAQVGAGALLTVLMQSSSASMAVALTAAQGGLLTPQGAAAMVIGANVGTTVKAVLAAIGATPNARRAAAAHVIFNVLTAAVALALLPWLVDAIGAAREALGLPGDPAAKLALFHTIFNVLGVLLMWPVADALTRWLQARFRGREEDEGAPRHLDDTVLAVPALAVDALAREVARLGAVARRLLHGALVGRPARELAVDHAIATRLEAAAESFVERINRTAMAAATSARLARVLRTQRYHESTLEQAQLAAALADAAAAPPSEVERHFKRTALELLAALDAGPADAALLERSEAAYEVLKRELLATGAEGGLPLARMDDALRRLSALRRALQQAAKGAAQTAADDSAHAARAGRAAGAGQGQTPATAATPSDPRGAAQPREPG
ncbi:MAG: Na/Pi cotransporter family protein [Rubrivivax sp.]|nr:Na/Pi cotransporter family protein [Rubrivivax sp.]